MLFMVITCQVQAQSVHEVDSIKGVIAQAKNDTTRIAAMIALSERIYLTDPEANLLLCQDALRQTDRALANGSLESSVRRTLTGLRGTAINNKGVSYFMFGSLDSALTMFRSAEEVYTKNGDHERIADALNNQGQVYGVMGNHQEQRRCLFTALSVYRTSKDKKNEGTALNNIGNYYGERGLPDSSLIYLEQSLAIFQELQDQRGIANGLLNIGMYYSERGKPVEALEWLHQCEVVYEKLGKDEGLATCLNNIGSIYSSQGILEEALAYYHRALDINLALSDKIAQANLHMNIGTILGQQDESEMALEEYNTSLALYKESGDRSGEALVHGHIGDVLKNKGERDIAKQHMLQSLEISSAIDDPASIATALYKLGHFHEDSGSLDSAMSYYQRGLELDRSTQDQRSESSTRSSIANIFLKQNKLEHAELEAEHAVRISREVGYPLGIVQATEVLHNVLANRGKWHRALEVLELHQQMKDSVLNTENAKKTVGLQLRYAFEKEQLTDSLEHVANLEQLEGEKRLAELEAEQARNKSLGFSIGGVLLIGSIGMIYRFDRKRRKERYERDSARLQTQILRTQMNPHFIFNALNSINEYVLENNKDLASGFLTKFSRLMRLVLENSQHAEVPLEQDLECLRLYMDLERSRMQNKFDYTIEVDPVIDQATTMVPPLVIQPFVENAIWHGISRKEGNGHIKLAVVQVGERLVMRVEDDGVGRTIVAHNTSTQPPNKTSLGTTITRDRLALLAQQRGGVAGFRFVEVEQGTCVEIEMTMAA